MQVVSIHGYILYTHIHITYENWYGLGDHLGNIKWQNTRHFHNSENCWQCLALFYSKIWKYDGVGALIYVLYIIYDVSKLIWRYWSNWLLLIHCPIITCSGIATFICTQIAGSMGPTWDHLGPVGPKWAPSWPHEPQGICRHKRFSLRICCTVVHKAHLNACKSAID